MSTTAAATRQIADGAITDAKVNASAAIATSKLALSGTIILKDGSVAYTGAQSMGNNKLTSVATPTTSTDAANKSYVDNAVAAVQQLFTAKSPGARAAMTTNVTVSNPATAVFDSVTLSNGDRLLLTGQTAPAENGLYVFNGSSSALTRTTDMDVWSEVTGALITVESEGTANKNTVWIATVPQAGTIGTTSITFQNIAVSTGLTNSNFVDSETPSGSINGSNTTFTLANTPVTGSVHLYLNGYRQNAGSGNDYTISGSTITYLTAPLTGEVLLADYRK